MIKIEDLRAVIRPYVARKSHISAMLEDLWLVIGEADSEPTDIVEAIHDLLALHAASVIDDTAFRQRIEALIFAPSVLVHADISNLHSVQSPVEQGRVLSISAWGLTRTIDTTL